MGFFIYTSMSINRDLKIIFGIILVIVTIFSSMIIGLFVYSSDISDELSKRNEKEYFLKGVDSEKVIYDKVSDNTHVISTEIDSDGEDFTHLFYQLTEVRNRYNSHYNTMIFFIRMQFISNIVEGILIGLTTMFGLYLVKTGWERANKYIMYLAFMMAGILTSLEIINATFNMETNVADNKEMCKVYRNLETDIIMSVTTGKQYAGENLTIKKYSNFIDQELIRNYSITFDLDNIPEDRYSIEYME